MEFYEALKNRRSRYDITSASPISQQHIATILGECITHTPSAFNSQSSRVVLLLEEKHKALWAIVHSALEAIVPADKFAATAKKIASFAAGYGTILFFEDTETITGFQKSFTEYADNFPIWSQQSAGMLQLAVWTALSAEGLGASLQHYAPLIDAQVTQQFALPKGWKLLAQMPFGTPASQPQPRAYNPLENRLILQGETK